MRKSSTLERLVCELRVWGEGWRGAACDRAPASEGCGPLEACQLLAGLWEVGPALGRGSHQPGVGGRRGPWPCCLSSVESVLVSVYVRLDFSNQTWPLTLSRTLTPPFASASSPPATLAGLGLTTGRGDSMEPCLSVALTLLVGEGGSDGKEPGLPRPAASLPERLPLSISWRVCKAQIGRAHV